MAQQYVDPAVFEAEWNAGKTPQAIMAGEDTASLAALGVPVSIGDLGITFSPENITKLGVIDSPLVSDDDGSGDQSVTMQDIANAVYVMANDADVLEPLQDLRHRQAMLASQEERARTLGPDFYERWLRVDSELGLVRSRWERDAMAYYDQHCAGMGLQDVTDCLVRGLADAFSWADSIGGDEKKTASESDAESMLNGSDARSDRWWCSAFRWMQRFRSRWRSPGGSP